MQAGSSAAPTLLRSTGDVLEFAYDGGAIVYTYSGGERKFLFLKRREGWLDIPKGHIEKGEKARDAAIRETFEETGLRIEPERFFRNQSDYWFKENGKTIKKKLTVFVAKTDGAAGVTVSREHVGHAWLSFTEAMEKLSFENGRETLKAANDYIDRIETMGKLNADYAKLPSEVRGWSLSKRLVPGEGPLNAKVMLLGQAPGRFEDEQGRPFIGASGKLLDRMIETAGLARDEAYITSTVQFFPPKNRVPSDEEIAACRRFLKRQIEIVDPKVVVLLGAVAAGELLGEKRVMMTHGNVVERERLYFVTIHPAAAVRLKKNIPLMESDFEKLKALLEAQDSK